MIPVHMEPKGLDRDTPAIKSKYPRISREAAERGSNRLRDAILRAKGHKVPEKPRKIARPVANDEYRCTGCGRFTTPAIGRIAQIQSEVAAYYGIKLQHMTSNRRTFEVSHPRQVAMYLAAEITSHSLIAIGQRFNRDHTTVIHAIKAVKLRLVDSELAADIEAIKAKLQA